MVPPGMAVAECNEVARRRGRRCAVEALSVMTYVAPAAASLEARWRAADGTPVTIRAIRAGDAAAEADFVRGLSAHSRRLRFMDGLRELTPRQLERFTQPDARRELALVALARPSVPPGDGDGAGAAGPGEGESIVAVARYVVDAEARGCEFAIVVADAWQRRGLGRHLLEQLAGLARGAGLETMRGTVMAENAAMLGLARRLGFHVTPLPGEYGLREVTLML